MARHGPRAARALPASSPRRSRPASEALAPYVDWSLQRRPARAAGAPPAGARRRRPAGAVRGDGLPGRALALLRGRARGGRSATPRARSPPPTSPAPSRWRTPPASSPCAAGADRARRQGGMVAAGARPPSRRWSGSSPGERLDRARGRQRPRLHGRLRRARGARRAARRLRGRRRPRPRPRRRLRRPLRPRRGDPRASCSSRPRADRPARGRDPLLLDGHRRAAATAPSSTPSTGTATCASRFASSRRSRALLERRLGAFVEISPHPVLTMAVQETAAASPRPPRSPPVGTLRRERGRRSSASPPRSPKPTPAGPRSDWGEPGRRPGPGPGGAADLPLPAAALLAGGPAAAGDAAAIGQSAAGHPLLGAAVSIPGGEERWLLTGRLSLPRAPFSVGHEETLRQS